MEELEQAAQQLSDPDAGWVYRRDAAQLLGNLAARALVALHDNRDEPDTDVRRSVDKALAQCSAALQGIAPDPRAHAYTLAELARSCARQGHREVEPDGDGFAVTVSLDGGRRQRVKLDRIRREGRPETVRIQTVCGPYAPQTAEWALRANLQLTLGAVGVADIDGEARFVITHNFLMDGATPPEVKASVKEIAIYGDWLERKLSGSDTF